MSAGSQNETSGGEADDGGAAGRTGAAGAPGEAGQSGDQGGVGPGCGPDVVLDITDQFSENAQTLQPHMRGLGLKVRGNATAVRLNESTYRVFALDTNSRIVYADVPRDPDVEWSPEWSAIGLPSDQFFGPPSAVTESDNRHRVFAVGFQYFTLNQNIWDGASFGYWSEAGARLLSGPLAVATGLDNLLLVGRCSESRICFTKQPFATADLSDINWSRLDVQTEFQPVALERSDGLHLAATARDGSVMYGRLSATDSEVVWTRLDGMCFKSGPALVARALSTDLFGQGLDGALYWQSQVGDEWQGWVKISPIFGSAPIAVTDGADGLLLASSDAQGYLWVRRFANGLWTDWVSFRYYGANIADQPFPGSALVLGQGDIRLLVQGSSSDLEELALTL